MAAAGARGTAAAPSSSQSGGSRVLKASARRVVRLTASRVSDESFRRFGQVIGPQEDGAACDFAAGDARLDLSQGTPRFYIMRLRDRGFSSGMRFRRCVAMGATTRGGDRDRDRGCLMSFARFPPWEG